MREIRFRGKRVDNGEWVYGPWIYELTGCLFIRERDGLQGLHVDSGTLGQYIGLRDKNGRGIYEGDIIRYDGRNFEITWDHHIGSNHGGPERSATEYVGFSIGWYGDGPFFEESFIIGNIHENPELLHE